MDCEGASTGIFIVGPDVRLIGTIGCDDCIQKGEASVGSCCVFDGEEIGCDGPFMGIYVLIDDKDAEGEIETSVPLVDCKTIS